MTPPNGNSYVGLSESLLGAPGRKEETVAENTPVGRIVEHAVVAVDLAENDLLGNVSRIFGGNGFAFNPTYAQLKHYDRVETGKKPYLPAELLEKWTWLQDACTSAGGATFSKTTTWPSALDEHRFR